MLLRVPGQRLWLVDKPLEGINSNEVCEGLCRARSSRFVLGGVAWFNPEAHKLTFHHTSPCHHVIYPWQCQPRKDIWSLELQVISMRVANASSFLSPKRRFAMQENRGILYKVQRPLRFLPMG